MKSIYLSALGCALGLGAFAQANAQVTVAVESTPPTPMFRVVVTNRTVQAVDYRHRGGVSEVGFAGTALMPSAEGNAKVRTKRGTMEVEAEFGNLTNPTSFGSEYLTYVMWAISPEGRAGFVLFLIAFLVGTLVLFAVAGGALGARMLARARRSEN